MSTMPPVVDYTGPAYRKVYDLIDEAGGRLQIRRVDMAAQLEMAERYLSDVLKRAELGGMLKVARRVGQTWGHPTANIYRLGMSWDQWVDQADKLVQQGRSVRRKADREAKAERKAITEKQADYLVYSVRLVEDAYLDATPLEQGAMSELTTDEIDEQLDGCDDDVLEVWV